MRSHRLKAAAVLVLLLASVHAAAAQVHPLPAPAGALRVEVQLEYSSFGERFDDSGDRVPLGISLGAPLTPDRYPLLDGIGTALETLLERLPDPTGTSNFSPQAEDLSLGSATLAGTRDIRVLPVSAELGITPWLSVAVTVPFLREGIDELRFLLEGGTLGRNPDPERNAEILTAVDAELAVLGRTAYLPLAGSRMGSELQERVRAATGGEELLLPSAPAVAAPVTPDALFDEFGGAIPEGGFMPWRVGDAEAEVRFHLGSAAGASPFPAGRSFAYRGYLDIRGRFPTGSVADTVRFPFPAVRTGLAGIGADLAYDLFITDRIWVTGGGEYTRFFGSDRLVRSPFGDEGESFGANRAARLDPGATTRLFFTPRLRFTDAISIGAHYDYGRREASTLNGVDEVGPGFGPLGEQRAQRWGAELRFIAFPDDGRRGPSIPLDVSLVYLSTFAGEGGAPVARSLGVQASAWVSLWGADGF